MFTSFYSKRHLLNCLKGNIVHRFELETLEYVSSIFGSKNILKIHSAGDLSFITPWKKFTADLADIPFSTNNAIVIPLKKNRQWQI